MSYQKIDGLPSWTNGTTKAAILDYVYRVTKVGARDYVPPEARTAVFDNDGTLWCEKPLPIELVFVLKKLSDMVAHDPLLRGRQPWKSAYERDYAWLSGAITKHYFGDDADVKVLVSGILRAFSGMAVEAYEAAASDFVHTAKHPFLGRRMYECTYQPMIELLRYLEGNGFTNYIASGGDRNFMRSIAKEIYGIPPQRVIGSSNGLRFEDDERGKGEVFYVEQPDVFDDGPAKPVRIWSRVGRRPIIAVGNSNGDIPMLRFCSDAAHPSLRLLIDHDDESREFAYQAGAEDLLECARKAEWTVVSVKHDWKTVFAHAASDAASA